jgi:hypothetical protein
MATSAQVSALERSLPTPQAKILQPALGRFF